MESLKSPDFVRLKKSGRKLSLTKWMLISVAPGPKPRLGITISRAAANAVLRNKLKRWTKDCFRKSKSLPKADMNLVFKKGKNYKELKYDQLKHLLQKGISEAKNFVEKK